MFSQQLAVATRAVAYEIQRQLFLLSDRELIDQNLRNGVQQRRRILSEDDVVQSGFILYQYLCITLFDVPYFCELLDLSHSLYLYLN